MIYILLVIWDWLSLQDLKKWIDIAKETDSNICRIIKMVWYWRCGVAALSTKKNAEECDQSWAFRTAFQNYKLKHMTCLKELHL